MTTKSLKENAMNDQRSYKLETFSATVENEIKRLSAQVDLFWEKELAFYRQCGLRDGLAIVECGCGPGFFLARLAERFPSGTFAGVEIDADLAAMAESKLSALGVRNFQVQHASITNTNLPANTFDFAFARLVLEHLPDPVAAVEELYRILKPGGKVVVIDNDFELHLVTYPRIPELQDLYAAYCASRENEGGNPKIGRQLPGLLREGGFANTGLDIIGVHSHFTGDRPFLKSEGVGISLQLVKDGYLRAETLDSISRQWRDLLSTRNHAFYRQLFVAVGEKPASAVALQDEDLPARQGRYLGLSPEALLASAPEVQYETMQRYLAGLIAMAVETDAAQIDGQATLVDLGFDSLAAVDVRAQVEADFGIEFSIVELFEKETLGKIARWLLEQINPKEGGESIKRAFRAAEGEEGTPWEEGEI